MTPTPIRGKVARIISSRELALNVGAHDGVTVGMVFDVLDPKAQDIKDPDSGAVLGSIRRPKIQVKVRQVEDRVSLAATFRGTKVNLGGQGAGAGITGLARLFEPARWVTEYETLRASDHDWDELDENESFVKVGDPVAQVLPETAVSSQAPDTPAPGAIEGEIA
jgi:hypothetical protein